MGHNHPLISVPGSPGPIGTQGPSGNQGSPTFTPSYNASFAIPDGRILTVQNGAVVSLAVVVPPSLGITWKTRLDNTLWVPKITNVSWTGTLWSLNDNITQLSVITTGVNANWSTGFRPQKIKVSVRGTDGLRVRLYSATNTLLASLDSANKTCTVNLSAVTIDIAYLDLMFAPYDTLEICSIEFYF
jgi:hypothetical protein